MSGLLAKIVLTGAGATFFVFVLTKFIPNDKLDGMFFRLGQIATQGGRSKLGKKFWETVESWIEDTFEVCYQAFRRGLNSDDANGNRKAGGK